MKKSILFSTFTSESGRQLLSFSLRCGQESFLIYLINHTGHLKSFIRITLVNHCIFKVMCSKKATADATTQYLLDSASSPFMHVFLDYSPFIITMESVVPKSQEGVAQNEGDQREREVVPTICAILSAVLCYYQSFTEPGAR